MVNPEIAQKWLAEVAKEEEIDSPRTKARKRASTTTFTTKKKKQQKLDETSDDNNEIDHDQISTPTASMRSSETHSKHSQHSLGSAQKDNLDQGIIAILNHCVREATYDISPNSARARPFMYWGPKTTACTKMLIKRTSAVRLLAEKYRRNEFARMYAKKLNLQQITKDPHKFDNSNLFSLDTHPTTP